MLLSDDRVNRICGVDVLFTKLNSVQDRETAQDIVNTLRPQRVICLDLGAKAEVLRFVKDNLLEERQVFVRDHGDVAGEPADDDARRIRSLADEIRGSGADVVISNHDAHPACSMLISFGMFYDPRSWEGNGTFIVADADTDGLFAVLKALGVHGYPGMEEDIPVLYGPREGRTADRMTQWAFRFSQAMDAAPRDDRAARVTAKKKAINLFLSCVFAGG